jgi:hypothetical protein
MPEVEETEEEAARGAVYAWILAKTMPLLIRLGTYLLVGTVGGAYGWWAWRRARQLEAAGVIPAPAPDPPAPGGIPPTSPSPWSRPG